MEKDRRSCSGHHSRSNCAWPIPDHQTRSRCQRAKHVSQTDPLIRGNIGSRALGEHNLRNVNPGFAEFILVHHAANRWLETAGLSGTRVAPGRETRMDKILGHVMTVAGSQMTVKLDADYRDQCSIGIGAMVKVRCADRQVVAAGCAVQCENSSPPERMLVADLLGEIIPFGEGVSRFSRGVSQHPISGEPVFATTDADLKAIFAQTSRSSVRIGTLYRDATQAAYVLINELLRKHFVVLGTTGSGKSCAVTLLLSAIVSDYPAAHIVEPVEELGGGVDLVVMLAVREDGQLMEVFGKPRCG